MIAKAEESSSILSTYALLSIFTVLCALDLIFLQLTFLRMLDFQKVTFL